MDLLVFGDDIMWLKMQSLIRVHFILSFHNKLQLKNFMEQIRVSFVFVFICFDLQYDAPFFLFLFFPKPSSDEKFMKIHTYDNKSFELCASAFQGK